MLTSLCVSFRELLWAFVASFVHLNAVCGAEARFPDSVHQEKLYNELLLRWSGVQTKWHQRASWVVGAETCGVCPFLLSIPTCWVCIVRACCMLGMALVGPPLTHTTTNALHGSRHERSWVVKALALSGNSWLGRHGGSWLLVLLSLLLFVV